MYLTSFQTLADLHSTGKFEFHVVTARQHIIEHVTKAWLQIHFKDIFSTVNHCNAYGEGTRREKHEVCKEIGACLLIDDHFKNIKTCLDNGMRGILFNLNGEYSWSPLPTVPEMCFYAESWTAVAEHLMSLVPA